MDNGTGRFISGVYIIPLDNMSNRTRQQLVHYHHSRKTEVRRNFAYLHDTANDLSTEMKDMYTNAPASNISKMPEPFRTAG